MPRKTDGMLFELHPRPTKGEDGKPLLYARPAKGLKMTMKQIDGFCARNRGMRMGEMERTFDTFIEVTRLFLADGYRIQTPLGTFSPKLKLMGDFTEPEKVRGRDVSFAGIEFRPSREFVKEVARRQMGFRKDKGMVGNAQLHDAKTMEQALRKSTERGYTTISTFQYFSGLKYHSAKQYLDSLCEGADARLDRFRDGRTFHYVPKKVKGTE